MSKWEDQVKVDLNDIFDDDIGSEIIEKPTEKKEIDKTKEYLEDIDDYFTGEEQVDLASQGIKLTHGKEYYLDKEKKPIVRGKVTNIFKDWLKDNHPNGLKYLKKDTKKKDSITPKELQSKMKKYKENEKYKQSLTWLFVFMGNMEFIDYVPSDEDVKKLEEIDGMINNA